MTIEQINNWSAEWASLTLAILWQSTLLVLVVGALTYALPRSLPAVRCWLWRMAAVKLLVMPLWVLATPLPLWNFVQETATTRPATGAADFAIAPLNSPAPAPAPFGGPASPMPTVTATHWLTRVDWTTWLAASWLAILCWQVCRIAVQRRRLSRLLDAAQPADERSVELVQQAARQLGLSFEPRVLLTDEQCSPFVCGVWRPMIVLPKRIVNSLHETELRSVLLHELAHIRRGDLAWAWVAEAARVLYFFHPAAHWVVHRLGVEGELACDQMAIAANDKNAADYADTLVKIVSQIVDPAERELRAFV